MPVSFPSSGLWLLKVLARDDRFVFGVYRRHMKAIGYLEHARPAVWGAGDHAQLEYHDRDRQGSE
jgi:hypothetical protein